jgi:hypothetical protein
MAQLKIWNGTAWVPAVVGARGIQGVQGLQGTQGLQGVQGVQGTQGLQGLQGTQGTQGIQGTQGVQGLEGIQGVQGTQGIQGITGTQGVQGTQGIQGIQGIQGLIGDDGFVAQAEPPTNTSLLWLDTDQPASTLNLGTTLSPGILQLTDSVSSTSTTTAATPNSVKTAYDLALLKFQQLKKRSGWHYRTMTNQYAAIPAVNNVVYYTPIFMDSTTTFDRISMITASTFSGTATVRLGIFADTDGLPSTLIVDAGTVTATLASGVYSITINETVNAGFYWLAFCQQGTAPTVGQYIGHNDSRGVFNLLGTSGATPGAQQPTGYGQASVTGAFSNASPAMGGQTNQIHTWVRVA